MISTFPVLACGSIGLTNTDVMLLGTAFLLWVLSFFLAIANIAFIATTKRGRAHWHSLFLLCYGTLGWLLYKALLPALNWPHVQMFYVYAIPLLVILHFVVLFRQGWKRWRGPLNGSGMSALEMAQADENRLPQGKRQKG